MNQHDQSSAKGSNDEQPSQNVKGTETQQGNTVDTCTIGFLPNERKRER